MPHQISDDRYNSRRRNYVINVQEAKEHSAEPGKAVSPAKPDGHEMSEYTAKLFLGLVVLVLIAGAVALWHFTLGKPNNPLPASIRQSTSYSLYYPAKEPVGYSVDQSTIKSVNGVVTYNLTKPDSSPIVVTQQATPKGFDPKSLFQHNPLPTTISPLGTIYDLSYKNQTRFMINSADSLIFISSDGKITNAQLQQIVQGLKVSK
jgi:hypothetical protein